MKEFKPTSWSIDNRTTIYLVTIIITIFGIISYNTLQKEKFPDIVIPTIFVGTIYPGTSPSDMENLVSRPIEKEIKAISGVKKVTSTSLQDYSAIAVEFNTNVTVADAKQRVKDALDKARNDLPTDLPTEPNVNDINFADIPIMFVNLAGNYSLSKLKEFADDLQERIEEQKEITRVDIVGALDKEVKVDVDLYKMQAAKITFNDITNAIRFENMTISGGNVPVGGMQRSIRIVGQYTDAREIGNIVIKSGTGGHIPLKEIANVEQGFKKRESFARLNHNPVITLNVVKRSGENLVEATDKVRDIVSEMQQKEFPSDLIVTITGDQSTMTRNILDDLVNTIIIGFILVTLILMFFMGTTNALFVALSVPISSFLAFIVLQSMGISMNMIVLFSFLLALGIVVDDAIVVIENTHRIYHNTSRNIIDSAKFAAGEVFIPVLSGTLTTLAPFVPLLFWPGIIGKFMYYLPLTLIVTLLASLLVAFIINPVFAVSFMKRDKDANTNEKSNTFRNSLIILGVVALLSHISGYTGFGNLVIFIMLFIVLNKFIFTKWIAAFQEKALPRFMDAYEKIVRWSLKGSRPWLTMIAIVFLFIFSIILTAIRQPQVTFFPSGDPNFIYVYIQMPVGTDVKVTDSIAGIIEKKVYAIVGDNNPDVESIIINVAIGAGDGMSFGGGNAESHKAKVTVAFKELKERSGPNTVTYMDKIRESVKNIPGTDITVQKEQNGPPTGKPISIEISGDDFVTLLKLSKNVERYIDSMQISGIEELKSDLEDTKPEITINIDRERANMEGLSTGQIANEIRTAVFGIEASKFKEGEEEFPIQVRYAEQYRENIDQLADLKITFRDMSTNQLRQIPLSAVAKVDYTNTYGAIKRKNLKRVITLSSNVLTGYNANEVVQQIKNNLSSFKTPEGYTLSMTGEQEDQAETANFLGTAGLISLFLILLIMVLQFNSISKPVIILTEIIFSVIGVLLGFSIFKMPLSIVMTGVGVVALAGIVVKNGILLIEFTDVLRERGMKTIPAIIQAGRTRLTPVMLTATAAVLGLVPLAIGLNINFFTLFSEFRPHFFVGGESMVFWGPLAWTIIFGLSFATVITLLVVPAMYLLNHKLKIWLKRKRILPRGYKV